jgi:hypothetical protein
MFSLFSSFTLVPNNAIQTRSKTSILDVKLALQIDKLDTTKDKIIGVYLQAAKEQADGLVNRSFTNTDGTLQPIPNRIEMWLVKETARAFEQPYGLDSETDPHIGMVKWVATLDTKDIIGLRYNVGF